MLARFSQRHLLAAVAFAAFALVLATAPARAVPIGPTFPAPGGTDFSFVGDIGRAGGTTLTLENFDASAFDQLWWGPSDFGAGFVVGSAMDGAIDTPGEFMDLINFGSGGAVWGGFTAIETTSGRQTVETRFAITVLDGTTGFIDASSLGIDFSVAPTVAEITGDPFRVQMRFLAKFTSSVGFTPFLDFFDANKTPASGQNLAQTSVNGGLFYTEPVTAIPEPASLALLGTALLLLAGAARRRARA